MLITNILRAALALTLVAFHGSAFAQQKTRSSELTISSVLQEEVAAYEIELRDPAKTKLKLHPEPVLSWVNPVRYQQQGLVYVWTDQGKARAIGGVFTNYFSETRMYTSHEFHSLSSVGLQAKFAGKDVWHPDEPGLSFQAVVDAPAPATKKPARLLQMRRMAQKFSAHSITHESSRYELRLLSTPLFRYETAEDDIHDGAIFSMVSSAGTDPEILLVFEVTDTAQGPKWHYAAARFSDSKLYLNLEEQQVWEFVYPDGIAGYKHQVSETDRYRLFDNREFTAKEMKQLLKSAKEKTTVPAKQ